MSKAKTDMFQLINLTFMLRLEEVLKMRVNTTLNLLTILTIFVRMIFRM